MDFGIARSTLPRQLPHDARVAIWHTRLHGAGTGAGRTGRRAHRRLRLRPDPVRAPRRRTAAQRTLKAGSRICSRGWRRVRRRCGRCCPMSPRGRAIVNKCLTPSPEGRYPSCQRAAGRSRDARQKGRGRLAAQRDSRGPGCAVILVARHRADRRDLVVRITAVHTAAPAPRAPLPVLIVDFENRAGETVFDGALEQALSIAMEGAPFITAFPRRDAATGWCVSSSSDHGSTRAAAGCCRSAKASR